MPKITLNKYQKIGLVLSLLWVVIVFFNVRNSQVADAAGQGKLSYRICAVTKALNHNADLASCETERAETTAIFSEGLNINATGAALLSVPFMWLAAFILFHLGRGIKIGYQAVVPWATFTLKQKVYAGSCLAVLAITGYAGLLIYLHMVADSRVPVGMSSGLKPELYEGNSVFFSGTWTRQGLSEGSGMGDPINLSSFQCDRPTMTCIEGQAQVSAAGSSGHALSSSVLTHALDTWTKTEITYKDENRCATTNYTIDLVSGAVNGVGRLTNIGAPGCMPAGRLDEDAAKHWPDTSWTMTLSYDGFGIYWAERKKAFPKIAKLIAPFL